MVHISKGMIKLTKDSVFLQIFLYLLYYVGYIRDNTWQCVYNTKALPRLDHGHLLKKKNLDHLYFLAIELSSYTLFPNRYQDFHEQMIGHVFRQP